MSLRHASHLRERFDAIGISKNLSSALAAQVSQWVKESGQEWTVNRLKLLKTGFLRRIAGEAYQLPFVATRKDSQGAVPKGPFGALWNEVHVSDIKTISRALNCMMVYSTFMSEVVTKKQWDKFHLSMTRALPDPVLLGEVLNLLRVPKWMRVEQGVELETFEEFVVRKGYTPKYVSDAIENFVETDTGMALWEEFPQYRTCFNTLASPIDTRIGFDDLFGYHDPLDADLTDAPIGTLGVTQEPGYKLRVFANPNIVHQMAMSRMKRQLFSLLRRVKWDCTFNQEDGTSWVKAQLNSGRRVFSIDLSDATNNFPLQVQLNILQEIGCAKEDVELFHQLSRAPWRSTHEGKGQNYRWTVGQPLGLGPSFAAFALTHGVLVHSIARANRVTDCFRVLGDDIVISDASVASQYFDVMAKLGIPISMDKTISSTGFAEFAGKLVSRDGILAGLKWREPSDRSFLDVVRLLGPRSLSMLRPRQRRVADVISVLPQPEGFGWNPYGIPLQSRMQVLHAWKELTDEPERSYFPLQRAWNRVRRGLEQPYFRLRFTHVPEGSWWDQPIGKASVVSGHEPTPVGSGMHLLSISEMTGSTLKLPESSFTPYLKRELKRRGFITMTSVSDPRGLNPLESLERKLTKLQLLLEQTGLIHPSS